MTKTRFTPWVVLACIGTLAGCTSGEGGTAGNTELNVVIPTGGGSSAPADIDIQVVEYTINCDATNPGTFPGVTNVEPTFNPDVTINGVLEVLDTDAGASQAQNFGPDLGTVDVWQAFMDIPLEAACTVQLRGRDDDGEVICTATQPFNTTQAPGSPAFVPGDTVKVNVLMICDISYQYPVAMLDLDGDFQFNISNFCPDLFVLNCIDSELDIRTIPGVGEVAPTACQVRARDGDSQCGDSCDPQSCVEDTEGLTCTAAAGTLKCDNDLTRPCADDADCENGGTCIDVGAGLVTVVACIPPGFACAAPGASFGAPCNPFNPDGSLGNTDCGLPPANTCAPGSPLAGDPCDSSAADAGNSDCGLLPPSDTIPAVCVPPVCAPGGVMDCDGIPNDPDTGAPPFDLSCSYRGDVLGEIGGGAPGPLQPGPGGFFIQCILGDDDGDPETPDVPLTPGATVTCQATTTDGDTDCDKTKVVRVTCPGLTPCQDFGGDTECDVQSTSVCQAGTCNDATCDGATAAACCDYAAVPDSSAVDCSAECTTGADCELSPGLCVGGVCTSQDCNDPSVGCPDTGNDCTVNVCEAGGSCTLTNVTGTCNSGTGICAGDTCVDNCSTTVCDSPPTGNPQCQTGSCDPAGNGGAVCTNNGSCCSYANDDANACDTCTNPGGGCICDTGACINGCLVPGAVDAPGIPMACRNSFNQVVSTFPIDLLNVTPNDCILPGLNVNFDMDPTVSLDTAFLQAAADTLCDLGTALTAADISTAQVTIDGVNGATCTEQLTSVPGVGAPCDSDAVCEALSSDPNIFCGDFIAEDPPTGQIDTCLLKVELDVTVIGTCGAGGGVIINSGVSLPLPAVTLPCGITGVSGDDVPICSTGEVPLAINLVSPVEDTFIGVSVGGGAIRVVFQCNTSSTTNPPPGTENEIGCASNDFPSTVDGQTCAQAVGTGNVGEQPFPTSLCLTTEPPSNVCVGGSNDDLPCKEITVNADCPGAPQPKCVGGDTDFADCDTDDDCPGQITLPSGVVIDSYCSVCARPRCTAFGNPIGCTGTCATVPIGVPPTDVCANFTVQ